MFAVPISYNGFTFSDGNLSATFPHQSLDAQVSPVYVPRGSAPAAFATIQLAARAIPIEFHVTDGNLTAGEAWLMAALNLRLGTERTLTAQLLDGTTVEIAAVPNSKVTEYPGTWTVLFTAGEYSWRSSTSTTASMTGPASPSGSGLGTVAASLTAGGNDRTLPAVTLTPLINHPGSQIFSEGYTIADTSGLGVTNFPTLITFDHASRVTAGQSRSDGTDLIVLVNGVSVTRSVTGANTSTCRVLFPVTLTPSQSIALQLTMSATDQLYSGTTYAQDLGAVTVTELSGNALTSYPYQLTVNHASIVSAGRSQSSGADIRVWVNGAEVNRVVLNPNTATTKLWFGLTIGKSGTAQVVVTFAASGYNYPGGSYTNGSLDLTASSNGTWVYTTPAVDSGGLPGELTPVTTSPVKLVLSGHCEIDTVAGGVECRGGPTSQSMSGNGNYVTVSAGGVPILTASYALTVAGSAFASEAVAVVASQAVGGAWHSEVQYTANQAYTTTPLTSGRVGVGFGLERDNGTFGVEYDATWGGSGSNHLQVTLDTTKTPGATSLSLPSATDTGASATYVMNGTLTDTTGHRITVTQLSLTLGDGVVLDADSRTAYLVDGSGTLISGSAATVRPTLTISGPDPDWLSADPGVAESFTWSETNLAANGIEVSVAAVDRWL